MKKLIVFCMLICSSICQSQKMKEWTYPVMPGTEQWKAFQSHQEMLEACQIPKSVLQSISTERLLQLCLDYPLLLDIYDLIKYQMDLILSTQVLTVYRN